MHFIFIYTVNTYVNKLLFWMLLIVINRFDRPNFRALQEVKKVSVEISRSDINILLLVVNPSFGPDC